MRIGDLARRSGFTASTIRYYEEVGLLPIPLRVGGCRVYDEQIFHRLLVVKFAKDAGFSLREVCQLFTGFVSDTPAGTRWKQLATAKLVEVEALAARIDAMKQLLEETLRCGCIDLDACGRLFRERMNEGLERGPVRPVRKVVR